MSNQKKYKTKSFEEKKQEVDHLIESAEKKIEEHFISEESIKECLRSVSYTHLDVYKRQSQYRRTRSV